MKTKIFLSVFILLFLSLAGIYIFQPAQPVSRIASSSKAENKLNKHHAPYDHLFVQRSYPDSFMDMEAYEHAMLQAHQLAHKKQQDKSIAWTVEGPGNIGGRINCVTASPSNSNIIYVGNASGGVYKTSNGGASWQPIFDAQPFLAIGAITVDPVNHATVWVGTGDVNISGYPFIGNGVYKSVDGGNNWQHMGLTNTRIVSKIIVDPNNSNIVYVATMGIPFFPDNNRGLYKSTDGGQTWTQVLFVSNDAGICDLVIDPTNTNILYAASWKRIRNYQQSIGYGNESRIWKSTDGGQTWNMLTNGLPNFPVSRIGLAISAQNPNHLYSIIVDSTYSLQGIYKTLNGGSSWTTVPTGTFDYGLYSGFAWYFGKIHVNPSNFNQIYVPGVELQSTTDGGLNWFAATPPWYLYEVHADGHGMHFINANTILYSTDGGLYKTTNNCVTWTDIENIPNTQFYRVAVNPHKPNLYYGGAQDNGTTGGNAQSINNWSRIFGGDGFTHIYHPTDPDIHYAEYQWGGIVYTDTDGAWYDYCDNGIDPSDRRCWDMPYIMSKANPSTLYCGTYRVYRMTGAPYGTWVPISSDLTDGIIHLTSLHTITSVAESPVNATYLYAGTGDGNVWRSMNTGGSWQKINGTLPKRYVTCVKASPNQASNVYVTQSGYKSGEYIPRVHRSTDNGQTWVDISGDLTQSAVNHIEILPGNENILFVATDDGVYITVNAGQEWHRIGNNMPIVPVYDIDINTQTNRLLAGTFARSLWSISIPQLVATIPNAIDNLENAGVSVRVFPNPAVNFLQVEAFTEGNANIRIYSIQGKLCKNLQTIWQNGRIHIPVSDLATGSYVVSVETNEKTYYSKFIKQ